MGIECGYSFISIKVIEEARSVILIIVSSLSIPCLLFLILNVTDPEGNFSPLELHNVNAIAQSPPANSVLCQNDLEKVLLSS